MSTDVHTFTTTGRAILRCVVKGCRTPHQIEVRTTTEISAYLGRQMTATYVDTPRGRASVRDQHELAEVVTRGRACTGCGAKRLEFLKVQGTYVPTVKCGRRCTSAVGPSCDCSCSGKNHAIDHQRL